jgi:DNA-binding XRE family transcriptional regulator
MYIILYLFYRYNSTIIPQLPAETAYSCRIHMTDPVEDLQARLGDQLRRLRLARDLDQLTLADKAGVSEKALRNLEGGRGSSLSTLLQVLRALDRLDWLDLLAPVASVSPMALLRRRPERRRVGRPRRKAAAAK